MRDGIDDAARRRQVEEMQAHHIDAVTGQRGGVQGGVFVGRKQDGAAAPIGEVDAPEADAPAAGFDEVAALNADKAILAGGRVEQEGDIGGRGSAGAMIHHERLQQAVIPLSEGGDREEQEQQRPLVKSTRAFEVAWSELERLVGL